MNSLKPEWPEINEKEPTPLVDVLLEIMAWQIEKREQEIVKLRGETTKPDIKPSQMDKGNSTEKVDDERKSRKRRGPRRSKTENLRVDNVIEVQLDDIAVFKGYHKVIIQDIILKSLNTCCKLSGQLPKHLKGGHFGTDLISFIRHQHHHQHHQHVTQPLIHNFLHDLGVQISTGQVNKFINGDIETFHQKKNEIPALATRENMAIIRLSAMNFLHGLKAPKARAESTF